MDFQNYEPNINYKKNSIPDPGRPPYYSEEFFSAIRTVRKEGLLNVKTSSLKCWYIVLLENFVTTEVDANGFRFDKRCRIESAHPDIDWERTWSLASLPGLESCDYTFLWRMIHDILPTQDRLQRILRIVLSASLNKYVTLHMPCFLAATTMK
jgi:hypothetical protein